MLLNYLFYALHPLQTSSTSNLTKFKLSISVLNALNRCRFTNQIALNIIYPHAE